LKICHLVATGTVERTTPIEEKATHKALGIIIGIRKVLLIHPPEIKIGK